MFRQLTILSLITSFPFLHGQYLFPTEAYYVMYGNLLNYRKTFLPMDGVGVKDNAKIKTNISIGQALSDSYMVHTVDEVLDQFNTSRGSSIEDEVNQLNLQVLNLTVETRKRMKNSLNMRLWYWWDWYDRTDPYDYYRPLLEKRAEKRKKERLDAIALTYLIHTRYLLDSVLKQRLVLRTDKRYKMGYLFNRLRRLKTEMLKMVRMSYEANSLWWNQRIMAQMRLYEEIIHMDIDIRDTLWEIRDLFDVKEPYDYLEEKKRKNETNSTDTTTPGLEG